MKIGDKAIVSLFLIFAFCASAIAQNTDPKPSVVITNASIFDGTGDELTAPMSMLIEGNKIKKIAKSIAAPDGATVIDANGRTLTPGFIATHEHLIGQMSFGDVFTSDERHGAYVATQTVRTYLMNGYTAVRDAAGNTFWLKKCHRPGLRRWTPHLSIQADDLPDVGSCRPST